MFDGFLKYALSCEGCGANFEIEDAGDGPAIFIIFIAGFVIIPLAIGFQFKFGFSTFVTLIIWVPILIVFCLSLMRPLRGLMFALQWKNDAGEAGAKDLKK